MECLSRVHDLTDFPPDFHVRCRGPLGETAFAGRAIAAAALFGFFEEAIVARAAENRLWTAEDPLLCDVPCHVAAERALRAVRGEAPTPESTKLADFAAFVEVLHSWRYRGSWREYIVKFLTTFFPLYDSYFAMGERLLAAAARTGEPEAPIARRLWVLAAPKFPLPADVLAWGATSGLARSRPGRVVTVKEWKIVRFSYGHRMIVRPLRGFEGEPLTFLSPSPEVPMGAAAIDSSTNRVLAFGDGGAWGVWNLENRFQLARGELPLSREADSAVTAVSFNGSAFVASTAAALFRVEMDYATGKHETSVHELGKASLAVKDRPVKISADLRSWAYMHECDNSAYITVERLDRGPVRTTPVTVKVPDNRVEFWFDGDAVLYTARPGVKRIGSSEPVEPNPLVRVLEACGVKVVLSHKPSVTYRYGKTKVKGFIPYQFKLRTNYGNISEFFSWQLCPYGIYLAALIRDGVIVSYMGSYGHIKTRCNFVIMQ